MYKWFVWSAQLQKYLPLKGVVPYHRGQHPADIKDMFGNSCGTLISIPMFNRHNPAYFE